MLGSLVLSKYKHFVRGKHIGALKFSTFAILDGFNEKG